MLIFSGATLPYEVMPTSLQRIADVMPLTQGIKILKSATLGEPIENVILPLIITFVVAVLCASLSIKFFK